jgi:hypothetical protein
VRWKYLENPYLEEPLIYLAIDGKHVVGMRAVMGAMWQAGTSSPAVFLGVGADSGIHPSLQGQGLYSELSDYTYADLTLRGHKAILSTSSTAKTYVILTKHQGWIRLGNVAMVSRGVANSEGPEGGRKPIRQRWPRLARLAKRIGGGPFSKLDRRWAGRSDIQITDQVDPHRMIDLIERVGSDGRIQHVRDYGYLTWRYRHPYSRYRFLFAGRQRLDGFLVIARRSSTAPARLLDVEATEPAVVARLLECIADPHALSTVETWSSGLSATVSETMGASGFERAGVDEPPDTSSPSASAPSGQFMIKPFVTLGTPHFAVGSLRFDRGEDWGLRMANSDAF